MAATRTLLLIPVTLCSFLLVLAAAEQGKQKQATTTTLLHIHGIARCSNNFSRIVSNAPMYLVINNATVPGGTGRTTSDGQLLMTVTLNSTEQVAAVMSDGASIVAPRNACEPGEVCTAAVQPIAVATISVDGDDGGAAGSSVHRPSVAASVKPLPARLVDHRGVVETIVCTLGCLL